MRREGGRAAMVRHVQWSPLVLVAATLAACNAPVALAIGGAPKEEPGLCRPADIEPGVLEIGPKRFGPGEAFMTVEDSPEGWGPVLMIELRGAGEGALEELTRAHLGQKLPLRVDGEVLMSPHVGTPILGDSLQVSGLGGRSREELEAIAIRFAPPCPPKAEPTKD